MVSRFRIDKIIHNPLRTGEAAKALGVLAATKEIVLLQDSDNLLDSKSWLRTMVSPFKNSEVVGSEPLFYSYRGFDSLITRYCALLGMNDPICLYLGNYDRFSYVTGKWTSIPVETLDFRDFLLVRLDKNNLPTIGANGFMFRRSVLPTINLGQFLFDIDLIHTLVAKGMDHFAKVKVGIVHLFADSFQLFARKTLRRIRDYQFYQENRMRSYPWPGFSNKRLQWFVFSTVFTIPIARDCVKGYKARPDRAWFFHLPACWITLFIYSNLSLIEIAKTSLARNSNNASIL